jgi:hypothetical protein
MKTAVKIIQKQNAQSSSMKIKDYIELCVKFTIAVHVRQRIEEKQLRPLCVKFTIAVHVRQHTASKEKQL